MRVAILQSHIPHYRKAFFDRLSASGRHVYDIIHGDTDDPGRSGVPVGPLAASRMVRNLQVRLGRHSLLLQPGALTAVAFGGYDVVVTGALLSTPTNLAALLLAKATGSRMMMWTNLWHGDKGWWGQSQISIEKVLFGLLDGFIAYSDEVKGTLVAWGVAESRIFVAPNTVDTGTIEEDLPGIEERARALRRDLCPGGERLIVVVGKIEPEKRVPDSLRMFARLAAERGDVRMAVVGGGMGLDVVREMVEREGLSGVKVTGKVPAGAELPYFKAADCVLFPGHVGLAVIQAMAMAAACVASDTVSAEAAALSPANSLRFPAGDIDAMLGAVKRVLDHGPLAVRLRASAREDIVERASLERMVAGFEAAVEGVVHL